MKKLMIAFSIIGAGALIASAATEKQVISDWFEATTENYNPNTHAVSGGTLAPKPDGDATLAVVNDKFEIDSDIDNPVTFTAAAAATDPQSKVTFTLDPAPVPSAVLPTSKKLIISEAKVAFAIVKGDPANSFKAWVGGGSTDDTTDAWVTLSGAQMPKSEYTLVMDFDNRAGTKKVRFTVGETVLTGTGATDGWFDYGSTAIAKNIDFVGSATFSSLVGKQIKVVGEIIVIGDKGKITVKNEDISAMNATAQAKRYESADAFLAADAKTAYLGFVSDIKVAEAYALGLVKKDGNEMVAVDNGDLKVKADAQANVANGIPVNLNISPLAKSDTGATISYQLMGSATGADYTAVGDSVTDIANIKIPTDSITTDKKMRYFKVQTMVTLEPVTLEQ